MNAPINLRRLGGTDSAAILGLSGYSTPFGVYARIVDDAVNEQTPEMDAGKDLEDGILANLVRQKKLMIVSRPGSIEHPAREWQRLSLDALALHGDAQLCVVDAKVCADALDRHGPPEAPEIHWYELCQVQTYLEALQNDAVRELAGGSMYGPPKEAWLGVLTGPRPRVVPYGPIPYDPELGALIVEASEKFWHDHIVAKVPPAVDGSSAARRWLEKKHPRAEKEIREATPDEANLIAALRDLQQQGYAISAERDRIENILRLAIADARGIRSDAGSIQWINVKGGEVPGYTRAARRDLRPFFKKEKGT